MTNVTLICEECGTTARRSLVDEPGSRGVRETPSESALCPSGHGPMSRADGSRVRFDVVLTAAQKMVWHVGGNPGHVSVLDERGICCATCGYKPEDGPGE